MGKGGVVVIGIISYLLWLLFVDDFISTIQSTDGIKERDQRRQKGKEEELLLVLRPDGHVASILHLPSLDQRDLIQYLNSLF